MLHRELLVNGVFIGGPCDQSIPKEVSRNPWTGSTVGTSAEATWAECDAALQAAVDSQPAWAATPLRERQALLGCVAIALRERRDELSQLLVAEIAKPMTWARAEIDRTIITFQLAAEFEPNCDLPDFGPDPRACQYEFDIIRRPRGVVLAFTPSNWPFNLAAHKLGPALATGNTVVLKGSGQSPLCSLTLARIFHECGVPSGVLNAIQCVIPDAERMVRDPRVQHISFTGSPAVGWHLKQLRPDIPVTLELGGNAFVIVQPDADLDEVVRRVVPSAFGYAGQVCISAQHVLAHRSVEADLAARLTEATARLECADPSLESTICGPLLTRSSAERLVAWIEQSDGEVLAGMRVDRNRFEPTLVRIADFARAQAESKALVTEEAFGPVLTLSPFEALGDAFEMVNRSRYAIHTSLFGNQRDLEAAIAALRTGGIVWNDAPSVRFDALPYGGEKRSGFGREGIAEAFFDFTSALTVIRRV